MWRGLAETSVSCSPGEKFRTLQPSLCDGDCGLGWTALSTIQFLATEQLAKLSPPQTTPSPQTQEKRMSSRRHMPFGAVEVGLGAEVKFHYMGQPLY